MPGGVLRHTEGVLTSFNFPSVSGSGAVFSEYRELPRSISRSPGCTDNRTQMFHTHPLDPRGWSLEPGVSFKTRSDNRDSCRGWKPVLAAPPSTTTSSHTASRQPNKPLFLARAFGISFVMKWIRTREDHETLSLKKKLLLRWLLLTEPRLLTPLILNLLVQLAPSTLL